MLIGIFFIRSHVIYAPNLREDHGFCIQVDAENIQLWLIGSLKDMITSGLAFIPPAKIFTAKYA